jgi:hypothetical protein
MTASAYTWNGLTAEYLPHERELILALASGGHRQEAEFVHELKATFGATLDEGEGNPSVERSEDASRASADDRLGPQGLSPSSSVPTGHGSFAIPEGIQAKLASKGKR